MSTVREMLGVDVNEQFPLSDFLPFPAETETVPFINNLMKSPTAQLVWKKSIVSGYRILQVTAICPAKDSAIYKYDHPNCLWKGPKMLHFKHDSGNRKWWTEKPGMVFYFAIPENKINIYVKEDWTYPEINIDGTKITLTCSGGGGKVWTSWINDPVSTSTFTKVKNIKEIAIHSVFLPEIKEKLMKLPEQENTIADANCCKKYWEKKEARTDQTLEINDTIILLPKYKVDTDELKVKRIDMTIKQVKKTKEYANPDGNVVTSTYYDWEDGNRIKGVYTGYYYIKANQIDWIETNKLKELHNETH